MDSLKEIGRLYMLLLSTVRGVALDRGVPGRVPWRLINCKGGNMDTIKCGRITYTLEDGDTVMDNGSCLQLTSRKVTKGWSQHPPRVSQAEFKRFKENENVKLEQGSQIALWVYNKLKE